MKITKSTEFTVTISDLSEIPPIELPWLKGKHLPRMVTLVYSEPADWSGWCRVTVTADLVKKDGSVSDGRRSSREFRLGARYGDVPDPQVAALAERFRPMAEAVLAFSDEVSE